jgi:AcrR family transcriptional regulator
MKIEPLETSAATTKRNPELTRRRLMKAAERLFAKKGRDATSIDDICQASGVNCRMIYHYFGSKDGLYMAVLESVYGRISEIAVTADAESQSLAEYIEAIIDHYFHFLLANPEFVAILRWENASGAKGIRKLNLDEFRDQYVGAACKALSQQQGKPASLEEGRMVVLTCVSLCGHFFSNQGSTSHALGAKLGDSEFAEVWLEHIKKVAVTYFCS